jgi:hypothetical protein
LFDRATTPGGELEIDVSTITGLPPNDEIAVLASSNFFNRRESKLARSLWRESGFKITKDGESSSKTQFACPGVCLRGPPGGVSPLEQKRGAATRKD